MGIEIPVEPEKDIDSMTLDELKEYRNYCENKQKYHDSMQMAYKIMINSLYGAAGTNIFRYYDLRIAASITAMGRMVIRSSERAMSKYINSLVGGNRESYAVAGDTDSCYMDVWPVIEKFGMQDRPQLEKVDFLDKFCERLDAKAIKPLYNTIFHDFNGAPGNEKTLNMDREAICVNNKPDSYCGFWLARKHYFLLVNDMEGVRYDTPHVKEMGVQWKQTSYSAFARKTMSALVKTLTTKGIDAFRSELKAAKKVFLTLPPEQIAFPRGVTELQNYTNPKTGLPWEGTWYDMKEHKERNGGVPAHVKAGIRFNFMLKKCGLDKSVQPLTNGAKFYYVHLKENEYGFDTIGFRDTLPTEFGLDKAIDYELMWEKQIYKVMADVCKTCGVEVEKKRTLNDFF